MQTRLMDWINTVNTTNFRIVVSIVLAVLYVVVVLTAILFQAKLDNDTLQMLQWFLLGMMGLDVASFIGKRFSDSGYAAAKAAPQVNVNAAPTTVEVAAGGTGSGTQPTARSAQSATNLPPAVSSSVRDD